MYCEFIILKAVTDDEIGARIGGCLVNILQYADDTTLIAETAGYIVARVMKESGNLGELLP